MGLGSGSCGRRPEGSKVKVYLAKFRIGKSVAYKIGHTKYYHAIKRFEDPQYAMFDDIAILADINVQHTSPVVARLVASSVEAALQSVYPKNFMLEEFFGMKDNEFDGLSGITEMFILNGSDEEHMLVEIFQRASKKLYWIMQKGTTDV